MSKRKYILVVSQSRAAVFAQSDNEQDFRLVKKMRSRMEEIKGSSHKSFKSHSDFNSYGNYKNGEYKESISDDFSTDIVDYLEESKENNFFDTLLIVGESNCYNSLRNKITSELEKSLEGGYAKSFYTEKRHELSEFLDMV